MKKLLFTLFAVTGFSSLAATYYVSPSGNDENDGFSAETAFQTPAAAAAAANVNHEDKDEIILASGTYYLEEPLTVWNVRIIGATGNPEEVILDGQNKTQVVILHSSQIENVTVCHGYSYGTVPNWAYGNGPCFGAGISGFRENLKIDNCIVRDNVLAVGRVGAELGGAGIALEPYPELEYEPAVIANCRVYNNISTNGIGVGIRSRTHAVVTNCVVYNNVGYENPDLNPPSTLSVGGGGITVGSNSLIVDCTVYSNRLEDANGTLCGAGIYISSGVGFSRIIRTQVTENSIVSAGGNNQGAGIYLQGDCHIDDCEILNNFGDKTYGVALLFTGMTNILSNCHIEGNLDTSYPSCGGGLYVNKQYVGDYPYYLVENCTFRNNKGGLYGDAGAVIHFVPYKTIFEANGFGAIRNCLVVDNEAGHPLVFIDPANVTVSACTFKNNRTSYNNRAIGLGSPDIQFLNCVFTENIAYNSSGDVTNTFAQLGWETASLTPNKDPRQFHKFSHCLDDSRQLEGVGLNNLSSNPKLDENFVPTLRSPCRDAGIIEAWMTPRTTDLNGNKRVFGASVDIGAFELSYPTASHLLFR